MIVENKGSLATLEAAVHWPEHARVTGTVGANPMMMRKILIALYSSRCVSRLGMPAMIQAMPGQDVPAAPKDGGPINWEVIGVKRQ